MRIGQDYLPYYERLPQRDLSTIELVVIHCTELPDLHMAREFGEKVVYEQSGTGVSGHYYIDRNGQSFCFVPEDRVANHVVGYNQSSIGIELVNTGRYPQWFNSDSQNPIEQYSEIQIAALKELLIYLKEHLINLKSIARHSDLDTRTVPADDNPEILIRRRIDPGPQFPWEDLVRFWQSL
jgi:N-acetylmuramoyl-L-alanine amidase